MTYCPDNFMIETRFAKVHMWSKTNMIASDLPELMAKHLSRTKLRILTLLDSNLNDLNSHCLVFSLYLFS